MAVKSFGVNDALSNKVWSKRLDVEALKETNFANYVGTKKGSLAIEKTELKKGSGDKITCGLRALATGDGKTENEVLEGNEEQIDTYSDDLYINELRHAIRVKGEGTIDAQRVPYDMREEAYDTLKTWYDERADEIFFNQLAGNTAQTNEKRTGFNEVNAPDANHVIRAAAAATDQELTSSDTFSLDMIDKARNKAVQSQFPIRKIKGLGGEVDYVCFVHSDQVLDLRTDAATAGNWFDLQKARLQGGELAGNGIFNGALGVYNRTLLVESTRVPLAINSSTGVAITNTRRAIFCGAQAIACAYGKDSGPTKFRWTEELFDYGNELGVSVGCTFGMKKMRYNSEDYATVTMATYAAPAA